MAAPSIQIKLPSSFQPDHEQAVIAYLTHTMSGQSQMVLLFEAIDLLDQAIAVIESSHFNFRMLYQQVVDRVYADQYINELLALSNVRQQSP